MTIYSNLTDLELNIFYNSIGYRVDEIAAKNYSPY
jgi:hypothetical protein